jgi:hypothetical protein
MGPIHENNKITMDLGDLTALAKVTVNGAYFGGAWTHPYRLDISEYVKEGDNILKIEVVNTWSNRIIGDCKLPREKRETWAPHLRGYNAESPLQPFGLFGPVRILTIEQ